MSFSEAMNHGIAVKTEIFTSAFQVPNCILSTCSSNKLGTGNV